MTDPIEEIVQSAIYERRGNKPETWCFAHAARLGYVAGLREAARIVNSHQCVPGCEYMECEQVRTLATAIESAADRIEKGTQ